MFLNVITITIILSALPDTNGERRITNGKPIQGPKRYMAYLIKSPNSPQKYDAWLCGGAIVSPQYVVTSAACIEDVQHMYAIAGYDKYVRMDAIDTNACTKKRRKKVVYTCVPKAYDLDYEKIEKWSYIDIGVVKVESPYDFNDKSYESDCSYTPNKIVINYEPKYQEPGIDAVVLGWGHLEIWRKPSDQVDYNQNQLNYAPVKLTDKNECKKAYDKIPKMDDIIEKYMICSNRPGNIDDVGELIDKAKPLANGCTDANNDNPEKLVYCDDMDNAYYFRDATRKKFNTTNNTNTITRRNGICQNDHGGPMVSWVGSHEVLIGVASLFRVTDESKCIGPYLFTSTQCNGAFLDCIINGNNTSRRRGVCDKPPQERGFDLVQRTISWRDHPDGPADNERVRVQIRPQLPIRNA